MTKRINQIIKNETFQQNYKKIEECEKERIFCKHDMVHFLDVARIGEIINLKEQINVDEEMIYAAALLHDIGRHEQYLNGTPHEIASVPIAEKILDKCGFNEKETCVILKAIDNHRTKEIQNERNLSGILYRADKLSRACFSCQSEKECNWKNEKKNMELKQ